MASSVHVLVQTPENVDQFSLKAMSLLFNTLSRFAIAFLPRSRCL